MELEIGGVKIRFATRQEAKSIWCTATWECLECGAKGYLGPQAKQNTESGAYMAVRGEAERHIEAYHQVKP